MHLFRLLHSLSSLRSSSLLVFVFNVLKCYLWICFIYFITEILAWLQQITHISSFVVVKNAWNALLQFILFIIVISHILHMLLQSSTVINTQYIHLIGHEMWQNKNNKCSFGFVILCEILQVRVHDCWSVERSISAKFMTVCTSEFEALRQRNRISKSRILWISINISCLFELKWSETLMRAIKKPNKRGVSFIRCRHCFQSWAGEGAQIGF